jgi:hypothetical protein
MQRAPGVHHATCSCVQMGLEPELMATMTHELLKVGRRF